MGVAPVSPMVALSLKGKNFWHELTWALLLQNLISKLPWCFLSGSWRGTVYAFRTKCPPFIVYLSPRHPGGLCPPTPPPTPIEPERGEGVSSGRSLSPVILRETGESMAFLSPFFWRGADQETTFPDPNPPEPPIEPGRSINPKRDGEF